MIIEPGQHYTGAQLFSLFGIETAERARRAGVLRAVDVADPQSPVDRPASQRFLYAGVDVLAWLTAGAPTEAMR